MANQPKRFPDWALNDEVDPLTGVPNKVEPTPELVASGLKNEEPLGYPILNDQFNLIGRYVRYLEERINGLTATSSQPTLEAVYPVGAYYMSSDSTSPSTLFGFGTWQRVKGKFLVGLDEADTDFDGVGETGGSKDHAHTDNFSVDGHALTTNEMPSHDHGYRDRYYIEDNLESQPFSETAPSNYNNNTGSEGTDNDNDVFLYIDDATDNTGGGSAHDHGLSGGINTASNLPPYETAYIWKRTA